MEMKWTVGLGVEMRIECIGLSSLDRVWGI